MTHPFAMPVTPSSIPVDADELGFALNDAAQRYRKRAGGEIWAFSIPAATYLIGWMSLSQPGLTIAFLSAHQDLANAKSVPETEAAILKLSDAEGALFAALKGSRQ
jgi:hypothetical protein